MANFAGWQTVERGLSDSAVIRRSLNNCGTSVDDQVTVELE
jgi:hypothetical protein